jgi:Mannosyltransferase putative
MIKLLHFVPKLQASVCCFVANQCRTLTKVWKLNSTNVYQPGHSQLRKVFPYKPAAILSSTFSEVLFLDCDAYVIRDPEPLFLSDPMYLRFGALFYPDAMRSRQHPIVWGLFNTSCGENEYELDSAAILVDKQRVWNGLYLTKLMNDNHILFYRVCYYDLREEIIEVELFPLLHVSDGDKDTFRLAFRYLRLNYYLVMVPCTVSTRENFSPAAIKHSFF